TDIWAVGEFNPGVPPTETGRRTLAEHWDGTAWRIVPTPNPSWTGLDLATLEAADKVATNDVWAVGFSEDFGSLAIRTLTEHWDGTRWIIVPSPNPAGPKLPNQLFDVAAVAANDAWSVGAVTTDYRPLILHWDGSIWRAVANNCGGKYNELHGITALSVADIWAVGEFTTCHYDGKSWTAFAIPPSGGTDTLFDVSAVSANDVWAVGQSIFCDAYHCYAEPYAIHWNGSQWQKTLAPG